MYQRKGSEVIMNDQIDLLTKIHSAQSEVNSLQLDYWNSYSGLGTWQFWLMALLFILPLIALYLLIDKKRIFLLGFYGLNIHVWATYVDSYGARYGLWEYRYRLLPHFPFSVALDVAAFPVVFILVYQWTLNHNKNFYLYSIATAFAFPFIFIPILIKLNIYGFHNGMNSFYLFIINIGIVLLSKIITSIFLHLQTKAGKG